MPANPSKKKMSNVISISSSNSNTSITSGLIISVLKDFYIIVRLRRGNLIRNKGSLVGWDLKLYLCSKKINMCVCVCLCVCVCVSHSVVSNSLRPHGLQPTRLLCPWDSSGKNTGVGCRLLQKKLTMHISLEWFSRETNCSRHYHLALLFCFVLVITTLTTTMFNTRRNIPGCHVWREMAPED